MNERLPVRRVAGAGRGVGACSCTEGCACRRRAGSKAETIWKFVLTMALAVVVWWVLVNWPFGRGASAKDIVESELDTALDPVEKSDRTNTYVQIGSNGVEMLDLMWRRELEDEPLMADGGSRTITSGTNIFILNTRRLNGTNLTVVTRISKDPTNEVVMWIEHDSVGGAKMTWPEEPTRWPWWATVIVAGLAGAGLFGAGYGWGRWVEAGWWHRKRGEIE